MASNFQTQLTNNLMPYCIQTIPKIYIYIFSSKILMSTSGILDVKKLVKIGILNILRTIQGLKNTFGLNPKTGSRAAPGQRSHKDQHQAQDAPLRCDHLVCFSHQLSASSIHAREHLSLIFGSLVLGSHFTSEFFAIDFQRTWTCISQTTLCRARQFHVEKYSSTHLVFKPKTTRVPWKTKSILLLKLV